MKVEEIVCQAKQGFEKSFQEQSLYNRQTQSDEHLNKILNSLHITNNSTILDLGTGSGYLAFAIADKYRDCKVIGLDIVEQTLENNRERAKKHKLDNLSFVTYKGIDFPFADQIFDCITTRYALHHFPNIDKSFQEISRVLNITGSFFLSDPTPCPDDTERFVDDYMKMKKDGHIKYYTKNEFISLSQKSGMTMTDSFDTEISFPRQKETAVEYDEIIKKHNQSIIVKYKVNITEDNKYIYITQNVNNIIFTKCPMEVNQ